MSSALISLILALLLSATSKVEKTSFISQLLNHLSLPPRQVVTSLKIKLTETTNNLFELPNIKEQNLSLKAENQNLKLTLKRVTEQNQELKILGQETKFNQVVPLRLVSSNSHLTFTTSDFSNLSVGQAVVSGQNLVGIISEITPPIIKVLPLNHQDLNLNIQLDNGVRGTYQYFKDQPVIKGLDNQTAFNPNTLILTLPDKQIPENLIVGRLDKVTSSPADPSQQATIILEKTLNSTQFVAIVKP